MILDQAFKTRLSRFVAYTSLFTVPILIALNIYEIIYCPSNINISKLINITTILVICQLCYIVLVLSFHGFEEAISTLLSEFLTGVFARLFAVTRFLSDEIKKPSQYLSLFCLIAYFMMFYAIGFDDPKTFTNDPNIGVAQSKMKEVSQKIIPILFYLAVTYLSLIFIGFLFRFAKHTGGSFYFTDTYLKKTNDGSFKIIAAEIPQNSFVFAKEDDTDLTAELFHKSYKWTPWYMPKLEKKRSNASHIKFNDHSILLILKDGQPIGYSHIIPVNNHYWYRYRDGLISDRNFLGNFISPPNSNKIDEIPFGLILFSIAMEKPKVNRQQMNEYFNLAIAHHITEYARREFSNNSIIPCLLQNMGKNILDFFEGYETNGKEYSKDGARIICFDVKN